MKFLEFPAIDLVSSVVYCLIIIPLQFLFKRSPKRNSLSKLDLILEGINAGSIAHRGGVPENTVTAFRRSKQGGATAVEVDLQFTKDGHPVLFHDLTVDRVSDGSGYLQDMTLEEIQKLDVGCKYGHAGAIVPTLDEAVEALKELKMYMFLELKISGKQTVSTVVQLFKDNPLLYGRIIVISFIPHLIYEIRKLDPDIICGLVIDQKHDSNQFATKWRYPLVNATKWLKWKLLTSYMWKFLGVNLVLPCSVDILEKELDVEYFRAGKVRLVAWTVNSDSEKETFDKVLKLHYMTDHVTSTDQI